MTKGNVQENATGVSSGEVRGGSDVLLPGLLLNFQIDGGQKGYRVYDLHWAPPNSQDYQLFAQVLVPCVDHGDFNAQTEYWYFDDKQTSSLQGAGTNSTIKVSLAEDNYWLPTFTPPSGTEATTAEQVPWREEPPRTNGAYRNDGLGIELFYDAQNHIYKIDWYNAAQENWYFDKNSPLGSHVILTYDGNPYKFAWGWTSALTYAPS